MSDYRLQIIHVRKPTEPATGWQPGDKVETDLIDDLCLRLRGRLALRTEASAMKSIRAAWAELLHDLKRRI